MLAQRGVAHLPSGSWLRCPRETHHNAGSPATGTGCRAATGQVKHKQLCACTKPQFIKFVHTCTCFHFAALVKCHGLNTFSACFGKATICARA